MSLPYFPMYPADFEADTSHLTLEEDGAYNRLLRLMWMTPGCSLPDDDAWIMRRMRVDEATFKRVINPLIEEFFKRANGRVFNPRLTQEFKKVDETSRKRSAAFGRPPALPAAENKGKEEKPGFHFDKAGLSDTRALPEPEPEPDLFPPTPQGGDDRFQEFWDAYPHRNGQKKNRKGAEAKFAAALKRGVTAEQILAGVKAMGQFPDVQRGFARDPVTWLNQQGWTDEPPATGLTVINGGKPYKTDYQGRPEIGSEMVNAKGHRLRYINHYDGWMREWN